MPQKPSDITISFSFETPALLRERRRLKLFLAKLFKKEKQALSSLSYVFCSDEFLLNINNDFLKHNYYTDIITFNLAERSLPVEGEIYISIERVRDNASDLGVSVNHELHRVIFHGALHLCGYRDKSKSDIAEMRSAEERHLSLYFS